MGEGRPAPYDNPNLESLEQAGGEMMPPLLLNLNRGAARSSRVDAIFLARGEATVGALDVYADTYTRGNLAGSKSNLGYVCKIKSVEWHVGTTFGVSHSVDAFIRFVQPETGPREIQAILPASTEEDEGHVMNLGNVTWHNIDEAAVLAETDNNEWTALGEDIDSRHAFSVAEAVEDRDAQRRYNASLDDHDFHASDLQKEARKSAITREYGTLPEALTPAHKARMAQDPVAMTLKIEKIKGMLRKMHPVMAYKNADWVKEIAASVYTHTIDSIFQDLYYEDAQERTAINTIIQTGDFIASAAESAAAAADSPDPVLYN